VAELLVEKREGEGEGEVEIEQEDTRKKGQEEAHNWHPFMVVVHNLRLSLDC